MPKELLGKPKPKVIMSKELIYQVAQLHRQFPKDKEWSGLLVYEVLNGGVNDLENINIKAHAIFPMDIGEAAFTSFEDPEDWVKCFTQFPQVDPHKREVNSNWYLGKVH